MTVLRPAQLPLAIAVNLVQGAPGTRGVLGDDSASVLYMQGNRLLASLTVKEMYETTDHTTVGEIRRNYPKQATSAYVIGWGPHAASNADKMHDLVNDAFVNALPVVKEIVVHNGLICDDLHTTRTWRALEELPVTYMPDTEAARQIVAELCTTATYGNPESSKGVYVYAAGAQRLDILPVEAQNAAFLDMSPSKRIEFAHEELSRNALPPQTWNASVSAHLVINDPLVRDSILIEAITSDDTHIRENLHNLYRAAPRELRGDLATITAVSLLSRDLPHQTSHARALLQHTNHLASPQTAGLRVMMNNAVLHGYPTGLVDHISTINLAPALTKADTAWKNSHFSPRVPGIGTHVDLTTRSTTTVRTPASPDTGRSHTNTL